MEEYVAEVVVFVQQDGLVQFVKKVSDGPQSSTQFLRISRKIPAHVKHYVTYF